MDYTSIARAMILSRTHATHRVPSRAGYAPAAVLLSLLLAAPSASAYPFDTGGFTDGTDASSLTFNAGTTELTGPSVRLLTNGTVTGGSLVVSGLPGFLNSSTQESTSGDFASYSVKDSLQISNGQVFLETDTGVVTLDDATPSSGAFANGSFNRTAVSAGRLVLNGTTSGSFVSGNLTAPAAGWGVLTATADLSLGGTLTADILSPTLSLLVSTQPLNGPIALDPIGNPTVRVRLSLTAPNVSSSPQVERITLGQRAADTLIGTGVSHNDVNIRAAGPSASIGTSTVAFTRYSASPVVANVASTYYAKMIYWPSIIEVNGTYHLFAAVNSVASTTNVSIGHATSTDLVNWSWAATPVLNASTSGWDSHHVDKPWVIAEPNGTGYRMFYAGWASATRMQTGVATSTDLTTWTKYSGNPVLNYSASGWDTYNSGSPNVIYESSTWKMWYSGTTVTTGGGNSMGYATSSDGYNWTKYASNPVLSRGGAGSIDRDDLQASTVRRWNGVYYMYSSCNTNGAYHVCAATSTDGTSWTKHPGYILNATGSGWEALHAVTPDIIVNNGRFIMFYAGVETGGASEQLGRADADFVPGAVRARLDFGSRVPTSLASLSFSATVPASTTVQVLLRSSADGTTWSAFENLTATSTISSTPARRYVEWYALLNASVRADPPFFHGLTFDYRAYRSTGRYVSSPITYSEQISAAAVSVTTASPNSTLAIDISNDNGTTFSRVANGTFTNLTLAGNSLLYALNFEVTNQQTPVVDAVDIVVQRRGLPENVTVRMGSGGSRFFNATGVFNGAVNVSLPSAEMNAVIASTLATFPSATYVDVPFVVTSSHYGFVSLSAPRLTQTLKNPLTASFAPPGTALSVDENTTTAFTVAASTYPASVKVNTSWTFDGSPVAAATDRAAFNYSADFFAAGNHTLRVDVENGDFAYNHTWAVTVLNVNRLPSFTLVSPASPVSMSHTATVTFAAQADDLDLEPLTFVWRLDGRLLATGVTQVNLTQLALGPHLLQVRVFDPFGMITFNWSIVSTNAAPTFLAVNPPGNLSISHYLALAFDVAAADDDADPLNYLWRLDGVVLQNGSSAAFTVDNLSLGVHFVSLAVSDPFESATFVWAVTSTNAQPLIASVDPASDFTLSHTASRTLTAVATDGDGEPLVFGWTLDGLSLPSTGASETVGPLPVGAHAVRLRVADAYAFADFTWTLTSTNAPPALVVVEAPADGAARSHTQSVRLELAASDADGDPVALSWTVNGAGSGFTGALVLSPIGLGPVAVRLTASDGLASTEWTWNTTGTNAGPVILQFGPGTDLTVSFADATAFSGAATDEDGDPLTWRWFLDGALIATGNTSFAVGPQPTGRHEVRLAVSDGLLEAAMVVDLLSVDLPPTILGLDPVSDFTMSHTARRTVSVAVLDHEGAALSYLWRLDSLVLPSTTNSTQVGPLAPGAFVLHLEVSDATNVVVHEWGIEVTDSPPVVSGLAPQPGPLSVLAFADTTFTGRAVDADGDIVVLSWFDGNVPLNGTDSVTLRWTSAGVRVVTLEVLSGATRLTFNWSVAVTTLNAPPSISLSEPNSTVVIAVLDERLPFAVGVEDDALLPVTITWLLDGAEVGEGTGFVFVPRTEDIGTHQLTVRVSDGEFSAERGWQLEVIAQRPVQQVQGGEGTLLLVGLLAAAGAAAFVVQLRRRRR